VVVVVVVATAVAAAAVCCNKSGAVSTTISIIKRYLFLYKIATRFKPQDSSSGKNV
jgi:hypothetical protein